jgi:hypothetical protein
MTHPKEMMAMSTGVAAFRTSYDRMASTRSVRPFVAREKSAKPLAGWYGVPYSKQPGKSDAEKGAVWGIT